MQDIDKTKVSQEALAGRFVRIEFSPDSRVFYDKARGLDARGRILLMHGKPIRIDDDSPYIVSILDDNDIIRLLNTYAHTLSEVGRQLEDLQATVNDAAV